MKKLKKINTSAALAFVFTASLLLMSFLIA